MMYDKYYDFAIPPVKEVLALLISKKHLSNISKYFFDFAINFVVDNK